MSRLEGMGGHFEYHPGAKPRIYQHKIDGPCKHKFRGICQHETCLNKGKPCKRPWKCVKYERGFGYVIL